MDLDAVWVVSRVGRGMGVLDDGVIVEGEGEVLGVNLGCPIVTNGDSLAQLLESDALFPSYFEGDLYNCGVAKI